MNISNQPPISRAQQEQPEHAEGAKVEHGKMESGISVTREAVGSAAETIGKVVKFVFNSYADAIKSVIHGLDSARVSATKAFIGEKTAPANPQETRRAIQHKLGEMLGNKTLDPAAAKALIREANDFIADNMKEKDTDLYSGNLKYREEFDQHEFDIDFLKQMVENLQQRVTNDVFADVRNRELPKPPKPNLEDAVAHSRLESQIQTPPSASTPEATQSSRLDNLTGALSSMLGSVLHTLSSTKTESKPEKPPEPSEIAQAREELEQLEKQIPELEWGKEFFSQEGDLTPTEIQDYTEGIENAKARVEVLKEKIAKFENS